MYRLARLCGTELLCSGVFTVHVAFGAQAPGSLDGTFDSQDVLVPLRAERMTVQRAGRILVFPRWAGADIWRLKTDGSLDSMFANAAPLDGDVNRIVEQDDGKLLVQGFL